MQHNYMKQQKSSAMRHRWQPHVISRGSSKTSV